MNTLEARRGLSVDPRVRLPKFRWVRWGCPLDQHEDLLGVPSERVVNAGAGPG